MQAPKLLLIIQTLYLGELLIHCLCKQLKQISLNSLARDSDNLGFLATNHGSICATANTSCFISLHETGKVEKAIYDLKKKATWLSKVDPYDQ